MVKDLMAANPGKIRIVYRWVPFHNGSKDVVALIEAARMQDKLWPALEALLASQAEWSPGHTPQVAAAWKQLEGLGLNRERMTADMASPDIVNLIAQDLSPAGVYRPSPCSRSAHYSPNRSSTRIMSPATFVPRTRAGTARSVRPSLPRQTLVRHAWPSTTASTGVRPQPWVTGGARRSGTGTKCQPPLPG
ncbi:MAG: hypothetical protein NTW72_01245 [Gemmatimonadetes bacterium]|nr:hypothetical protein [Gemmatimonadota bacterium]